MDCHDDPREAEGKMHAALEEGCLGCHDPHVGLTPGLLKGADAEAVCLECHDDPRADDEVNHGAVSKRCSSCHQPHASDKANLL
jgi:predicted CXXCH cytochrome family protein